MKKIVLTGGGTGGHIFPLISVVENIEMENLEIYYIAPKGDYFLEKELLDKGVIFRRIYAGKIRRYFDPIAFLKNIVDMVKIPIGIIQSIIYLLVISTDLVFSKGGFGAFPVAVAAKVVGVPLILHESDASVGLANKIISGFATKIFTSFEETEGMEDKETIQVGNPIRKSVTEGDLERAAERFNLSRKKSIILILGGSQGSERINRMITVILPRMVQEFEIIHQCGKKNFDEMKKEVEELRNGEIKKYYHLYPFLESEEIADAYAVADLVVSRAGAGSIFEILANGRPSILIPLPEAAQNHQTKNAYQVAKSGAAIVLEEDNLTPHLFLERARSLFQPEERIKKMKGAAKAISKNEAGKDLANYLQEILNQKKS